MATGNEVQERGPTGGEGFVEQVLEDEDCQSLLGQWREAETRFVDDPRGAVEACDALVTDVMDRVTASFQADRLLLERKWAQEEEPSTEDLRATMQRYRALLQRLLTV